MHLVHSILDGGGEGKNNFNIKIVQGQEFDKY